MLDVEHIINSRMIRQSEVTVMLESATHVSGQSEEHLQIIIITADIYGVLIKHILPSTLLDVFTCEVGIIVIPFFIDKETEA